MYFIGLYFTSKIIPLTLIIYSIHTQYTMILYDKVLHNDLIILKYSRDVTLYGFDNNE